MVASLSTLRQRSGSTPHDAVTVDPRLSSHQSVSLALDRQRSHSRQAANFARPRTANVASQGRAARRSPYSLGKTSAQTPSIQTHQASRRDQIPIVLAELPLHHPPRFRALALFGRRPHQRVDSSIIPATENLHTSDICDYSIISCLIKRPRGAIGVQRTKPRLASATTDAPPPSLSTSAARCGLRSHLIADLEGPPSSLVQLHIAVWTGDTRDARPNSDIGGLLL